MTMLTIRDVEPLNKKQYLLRLSDGQEMRLYINAMFSAHVTQAEQEVAGVDFAPLSSLNNLELQPVYRVADYRMSAKISPALAQELLDAMTGVYASYTGGRVRPFRLHSRSVTDVT